MKQTSLRIVHCLRSPIGGVFRHVRDLAAMQQAAGHQVGVICELRDDGALEQLQFAQLQASLSLGLHRIAINRQIGLGDLSALWKIRRILTTIPADIIHGHGAKGGAYARLGAALSPATDKGIHRGTQRPLRFYSPHGGSLHYDAATFSVKMMFATERWQERFTDGLIFVSDYEQQIYQEKVGIPQCPQRVIKNGISQSEFAPVALDADCADFIFIGMMRDLKGPDLFIRALAQLHQWQQRQHMPPAQAVMIGEGPQRAKYIALVQQLGLSGSVRFMPAMPVREALRYGRIFVLSSRAESLPYILLEVLAAQRSVIATQIGGVAEILGHQSAALCAVSPAAIADKMQAALINTEQYQQSMPDPMQLRSCFSRETMAASVENFYRSRSSQT